MTVVLARNDFQDEGNMTVDVRNAFTSEPLSHIGATCTRPRSVPSLSNFICAGCSGPIITVGLTSSSVAFGELLMSPRHVQLSSLDREAYLM